MKLKDVALFSISLPRPEEFYHLNTEFLTVYCFDFQVMAFINCDLHQWNKPFRDHI